MIETIKKSVLAGVCISVGGIVYLSCVAKGHDWLGAFLFSVGLFTICVYEFSLYTGKVGYIALRFTDFAYMRSVILILVVNLLTTYIVGIICAYTFPAVEPVARAVYEKKLAAPLLRNFSAAVFCGMMMFLAVDTWCRGYKVGCVFFVAVFILSGFEHSIADSFYNGMALRYNAFFARNCALITVIVAGNGLGGMIIPLLTRKW